MTSTHNFCSRRSCIRYLALGGVASFHHRSALGQESKVSTLEEMERRLHEWQSQFPTKIRIEVVGRSVQGRPVLAAILTDSQIADENKEHLVITTTHSGVEKGATVAALRIIEWLLSSDAEANMTLQRQVIVVMPACNPDGYVKPAFANDHGHDAYLDWTKDGPKAPSEMPEAMAMQVVFDRFQPEVVSDIHGNDMSFPGYIHFEGHVNNPSLRSYEPEVERLMDEAGLEAGFPTHRGEADEQRIYAGSVAGFGPEKQSRKKPRIFSGTYAYLRYHTLMLASENAWPQSCLARHRRLFSIGNNVWTGEYDAGYPVRTILTHSHQIVAAGNNAAERRQSRVELWNKQHVVTHGFSNPQRAGFVFYACATSPSAASKWLGDSTLRSFQEAIKNHPQIDASVILRELSDHPDGSGQWGPAAKIEWAGNRGRTPSNERLTTGFAMRLRIPYRKSIINSIQLNGRTIDVAKDTTFATWLGRGYRFAQIDIPPNLLADSDLFIVTCRYEPNEQR